MVTAVQLLGLMAVLVGLTLLWSPWALVIGGALLAVVPELAEGMRRK